MCDSIFCFDAKSAAAAPARPPARRGARAPTAGAEDAPVPLPLPASRGARGERRADEGGGGRSVVAGPPPGARAMASGPGADGVFSAGAGKPADADDGVIFILENAPLETAKVGKGYAILNHDDHKNFLRKHKRDPTEYRPDILHQVCARKRPRRAGHERAHVPLGPRTRAAPSSGSTMVRRRLFNTMTRVSRCR